jgi:hypothetical protein
MTDNNVITFTHDEFDEFSKEYVTVKSNQILDIVKSGKNVVCTGMGGTSKTYCVQYVIDNLTNNGFIDYDQYCVCSFTGVASLNAGGQTINSTFMFPTRFTDPDIAADKWVTTISKGMKYKVLREFLGRLKIVINDEYSMTSNKFMTFMDLAFKKYYRNSNPFGGLIFICMGDPLQLLPVEQTSDRKPDICIDILDNPDFVNIQFDFGFRYLKKTETHYIFNKEWFNFLKDLRYGELSDNSNVLYNLGIKILTPREYIKFLDKFERLMMCQLNKTRNKWNESINKIYANRGSRIYNFGTDFYEIYTKVTDFEVRSRGMVLLKSITSESFIKNIINVCIKCNLVKISDREKNFGITAQTIDKLSSSIFIRKVDQQNDTDNYNSISDLSFNQSINGEVPIALPVSQDIRELGLIMIRINRPKFGSLQYDDLVNGSILKLKDINFDNIYNKYCVMEDYKSNVYNIGQVYRYNYNVASRRLIVGMQWPFVQSDSNNVHLVQGLTLDHAGYILDESIPYYDMFHSQYVALSRVRDPNNFIYIYSKDSTGKLFKSKDNIEEIMDPDTQRYRTQEAYKKIKKLVKIYKPVLEIMKSVEQN